MVNRVIRDDPSKSDMHNREGLSIKMVFKVFMDWRLWPIYVLGILHMGEFSSCWHVVYRHQTPSSVPVQTPQTYLTLILRNLGYTTTQTNLLSVPSKVIGLVTLLLFCYLSEIIDSRVGATILLQFWALPLLVARSPTGSSLPAPTATSPPSPRPSHTASPSARPPHTPLASRALTRRPRSMRRARPLLRRTCARIGTRTCCRSTGRASCPRGTRRGISTPRGCANLQAVRSPH